MKPYTYHIGWKDLDIHYYGVRYAQDCDPSDLWNPYKTSSDYVKYFIMENGEPDIIEVDRVFETTAIACEWEHRVLKKLKVANNPRWLNKTDNKSIPPLYGEEHPHFGKTGPDHHSYGKPNLKVAEYQKELYEADKHPFLDPVIRQKSVETRSGANHHMKRPEVADKVTGDKHYSKKEGYVCKTSGKNNSMKVGYQYRKVPCQFCGNEYGASGLKRHENFCQRHLTNLVVNTYDVC